MKMRYPSLCFPATPWCVAAAGAIAFTTMPCSAHSRAAVRVIARIASFEALYAANPRPPVIPIDDAKLTMRPQPCAFMCG